MQQPMRLHIKTLVRIGILAAIAAILMIFEFPIPFLAPGFYQLDFSEVPVLIGSLLMGPLIGCLIELIKILLNLVINGTVTAGVGEFANFIIGCSLVVPTSIIYRRSQSVRALIFGCIAGVLSMAVVGALLNYYVMLPLYATAFQVPLQAFIDMGTAINARIVDLRGFVLLAVVPFNVFKGIVVSLISVLLFKRIGRTLARY